MGIMETQLQIQFIIKADSIKFINLYKTWQKPYFSMIYGSYAQEQPSCKSSFKIFTFL